MSRTGRGGKQSPSQQTLKFNKPGSYTSSTHSGGLAYDPLGEISHREHAGRTTTNDTITDRVKKLEESHNNLDRNATNAFSGIHTSINRMERLTLAMEDQIKSILDTLDSIKTEISVQVEGLHEEIRDLWEAVENEDRGSER